jgi:Arc/MetJ-type ribon-helix-helix transcriptional regulator
MIIMVNVKMDSRMQQAIKKLADKQFSSMSSIIKQAIEKHLQEMGIDWRKEPEKSASKKSKPKP